MLCVVWQLLLGGGHRSIGEVLHVLFADRLDVLLLGSCRCTQIATLVASASTMVLLALLQFKTKLVDLLLIEFLHSVDL